MESLAVTKYQLAKLVQWVGQLDTRKRVQKIVYLLQSAGCPFDADFFLHRYGPYSHDVARLTDQLVNEGVLTETVSDNAAGKQYSYAVSKKGQEVLALLDTHKASQKMKESIARFDKLTKNLAKSDLRKLEVASTIAYYYRIDKNWDMARRHACHFKNIRPDTSFAAEAEQLAKSVCE
jgi:uncharacterized protein YwgA